MQKEYLCRKEIQMKQHTFKNTASDTVYYLKWETMSPQAVVVISHGMIEHPKRYDELAKYLNQHNICVYAVYHIGHGEVAKVLNHMGKGLYQLEKQYKRIGMNNVKLDVYPEARHEIYHEWNKQEVYENTLEFVRKVKKDWNLKN